jgi:hypothetical protein
LTTKKKYNNIYLFFNANNNSKINNFIEIENFVNTIIEKNDVNYDKILKLSIFFHKKNFIKLNKLLIKLNNDLDNFLFLLNKLCDTIKNNTNTIYIRNINALRDSYNELNNIYKINLKHNYSIPIFYDANKELKNLFISYGKITGYDNSNIYEIYKKLKNYFEIIFDYYKHEKILQHLTFLCQYNKNILNNISNNIKNDEFIIIQKDIENEERKISLVVDYLKDLKIVNANEILKNSGRVLENTRVLLDKFIVTNKFIEDSVK